MKKVLKIHPENTSLFIEAAQAVGGVIKFMNIVAETVNFIIYDNIIFDFYTFTELNKNQIKELKYMGFETKRCTD